MSSNRNIFLNKDPEPIEIKIIFSGTTIDLLKVGDALTSAHETIWDMGDGNYLNTINAYIEDYTYTGAYIEPAVKEIICTIQPIRHIESKLTSVVINGNSSSSSTYNKVKSIDFFNLKYIHQIACSFNNMTSINFNELEEIGYQIFITYNPYLTGLTLTNINLSNLYNFYVNRCPSIKNFDLSTINRLRTLNVEYCTSLTGLTLPVGTNAVEGIGIIDLSNTKLKNVDLTYFKYLRENVDIRLMYSNDLETVTFNNDLVQLGNMNFLYICYSKNIKDIDLSMFTHLGGNINIGHNSSTPISSLSGLTLPTSTNATNTLGFSANYTSLKNIDLSIFPKITTVNIFGCPYLTGITFGYIDPSVETTNLYLHANHALEELDISMFYNLSGYLRLGGYSLKNLYLPSAITSTNNINFYCYDTDYISELDLRIFEHMTGNVSINNNSALTGITFSSAITTTNNINSFYIYDNPLLTEVDVSMFDKMSGFVRFGHVENIILPSVITATNKLQSFSLHDTNNLEYFDFSVWGEIDGRLQIYNNASLTGLTLPAVISSTNLINGFYFYNNPKYEICDFSQFYKMGGSLDFSQNGSMHTLIFPSAITATNYVTTFKCYSNPNLTTLDISMFILFSKPSTTSTLLPFDCSDCSGLTTIYFPEVYTGNSNYVCINNYIYFNDCALNQTTVDALFAELKRYYSVITPAGNVTVRVDGGTNSPPSAQGLADISTLETIFSNAGRTITITKNT